MLNLLAQWARCNQIWQDLIIQSLFLITRMEAGALMFIKVKAKEDSIENKDSRILGQGRGRSIHFRLRAPQRWADRT